MPTTAYIRYHDSLEQKQKIEDAVIDTIVASMMRLNEKVAGEVLSFNPWPCIDEHRPLGSINRARIKAYEASSAFRHERNDRPRIDIDDIGQVPG